MNVNTSSSYTSTVSASYTVQIKKTEKTQTSGVQLSDTAKNYLSELKDKYKNVSFSVADFKTDEEAEKYMNGGGDYSCVITPDLLEKMATDESTRKEYEGIIENAGGEFDDMKEQLGDKSSEVKSYGMTVQNGKVSYYAIINDSLGKTGESGDAASDENSEPYFKTLGKDVKVSGGTIQELLDKLNEMSKSSKSDKTEKTEDKSAVKDGFAVEKSGGYTRYGGKTDGFDAKNDKVSGARNDGFDRTDNRYGKKQNHNDVHDIPKKNENSPKSFNFEV